MNINKKRYSDLELEAAIRYTKSKGIDTLWAEVYKYTIPNVQIIGHLETRLRSIGETLENM